MSLLIKREKKLIYQLFFHSVFRNKTQMCSPKLMTDKIVILLFLVEEFYLRVQCDNKNLITLIGQKRGFLRGVSCDFLL